MRRCLGCGAALPGRSWACADCGFAPVERRGVLHFPPRPGHGDGAFSAGQVEQLVSLEAASFWFRARNRLILRTLRKCFPGARSILEVGCGTGFVLEAIARAFPDAELAGADASAPALEHAARRVPRAGLWRVDAGLLPVEGEYDVVAAFDVLEHTADDAGAIAQLRRAARAGGGVVVTAPQHPFLWSRADERAGHRRRYRRGELREALRRAGLRPVLETGFMALALPLMAASRLGRRARYDPSAEHRHGPLAAGALAGLAGIEHALFRAGVRFPFGGSVLVAARREAGA